MTPRSPWGRTLRVLTGPIPPPSLSRAQELLSREEELTRAAREQRSQAEQLRRREHLLAQWELEVFERELTLLLQQVDRERPHVRRRRGTFKRSKLRARDGGERISMPLGKGRGLARLPVIGYERRGGVGLVLASLGLVWGAGGWDCEPKAGRGGAGSVVFLMWAGSGGNICMAAREWLLPGRGGAHESSGKAVGARRVASGESSVGGVLAVRFPYGEPEAQESGDPGFSHAATVPELPSWPGSWLRALEGWNPGSRSPQTCTLLSPQPQTSNTASPCRPHPAWTGGETSSRLGLGTRPPSPGSGPSSVRNLSACFSPQHHILLSNLTLGAGSHCLLLTPHTQTPSPICLDRYLCVPWAAFI